MAAAVPCRKLRLIRQRGAAPRGSRTLPTYIEMLTAMPTPG
jgi:hypothetical protein